MKLKKFNVKTTLSALTFASAMIFGPVHPAPSASAIKGYHIQKVTSSAFSKLQANKQHSTNPSQTQSDEQIDTKPVLSDEKLAGIKLLAERLRVPYEEVKFRLQINEHCYLIPLLNLDEHKTCLIDVFANAKPEYMRYYLDGKLKTPERAEQIFFTNSLHRMWDNDLLRSLNFIIDCDNTSVGRIAVGPLYNRGAINAEVGYAIKESHSGKGIVSATVKTLMNFLQYLNDEGVCNLEKIRATAKADNIASNKILMKNNFVKNSEMINDGYGPENEYFYYLEKKE